MPASNGVLRSWPEKAVACSEVKISKESACSNTKKTTPVKRDELKSHQLKVESINHK